MTNTRAPIRWIALAALLALPACAGFEAANIPLDQWDPTHGYRPLSPSQHRERGNIQMYVAFSGGGTRAAALAYGVLQELNDTLIASGGESKPLLEEVDTVSGVSGGSFPAAYYGLFGDRIFEDFEERFLRKNIQGSLILQIFRPKNLVRLFTPWLSRSVLASHYYDEHIFDGATFADLAEAKGPRVFINATDLTSGHLFTFSQGQFDSICSDLDPFPIATAVASSSAVPVLLSPIPLRNYAGRCGFELPDWIVEALQSRKRDPRRYRSAEPIAAFLDAEKKPFVHLVDGGISDNLGLRPAIELVSAAGGIVDLTRIAQARPPDHLVALVVNAQTVPNPKIDLSPAAPGFAALMNTVSGAQIRRFNAETLILFQEAVRQWGHDLSSPGHEVQTHLIEVSFDNLADPEERHYFKTLPTSFKLSDEQVDRLEEVGRRLLLESEVYQKLVRQLQ